MSSWYQENESTNVIVESETGPTRLVRGQIDAALLNLIQLTSRCKVDEYPAYFGQDFLIL